MVGRVGVATLSSKARNDRGMDSRFRGNDIKGSGNDIKGSGNDIKGSGNDREESGVDVYLCVYARRQESVPYKELKTSKLVSCILKPITKN